MTKRGHVTVTGLATPGVVVRVYINDNLVAEGAAGADGRWKLAPPDPIGPGKHTLRLDRLASDGKPVARLELPFDRVVVAPGTEGQPAPDRGARRQSVEHRARPLRRGLPSHRDLRGQQGTDPQSRSDLSWPSLQPAQGQLRPRQQRTFHAGEFLRADPRRRLALHRDLCRVTFLAALTGAAWLFWPLFALTLWSIYFFRDPSRGVPQDDGVLVAPADGLVQMVVDAVPPAELGLGDQPLTRVSIFLSVFDVHINRTPCAGTVDVVAYRPGQVLNAAADKASEDNERMAIALRRADGRTIGCVQIAGWVARRIVCYIKPGQAVQAGERFGHIRFGSRTDLYLPPGARLLVAAGQRMIGGETVMAELDPVKTEPRRVVEF